MKNKIIKLLVANICDDFSDIIIVGLDEEKEEKENDTLKLEKKEKEGYVFKGWEDEDGKLYTDEVKISKNLKLKKDIL